MQEFDQVWDHIAHISSYQIRYIFCTIPHRCDTGHIMFNNILYQEYLSCRLCMALLVGFGSEFEIFSANQSSLIRQFLIGWQIKIFLPLFRHYFRSMPYMLHRSNADRHYFYIVKKILVILILINSMKFLKFKKMAVKWGTLMKKGSNLALNWIPLWIWIIRYFFKNL